MGISVSSANKVQLSEDAHSALMPFDCYVMALRGEVEIKVRLSCYGCGSMKHISLSHSTNYETDISVYRWLRNLSGNCTIQFQSMF